MKRLRCGACGTYSDVNEDGTDLFNDTIMVACGRCGILHVPTEFNILDLTDKQFELIEGNGE